MENGMKSLLTIDELSQATGVSVRTLRYYVSSGVLDKPTGETRNARYGTHHLDQVRNIKRLQEEGLTLNRILEIKKESLRDKLNKKEIGEPITTIEIPTDKGISIVFMKELCGLKKEEMIEIAKDFAQYIEMRQKEKTGCQTKKA